ncbi:MAG: tyrosine-protein phosphatase [Bacteriovoracia bacterium]
MKSISIFFLSAALACATATLASAASLPERFMAVSPGIYRGAQPTEENLQELKSTYGVKTILNLSNDELDMEDEAVWADRLGVKLFSRPMSGFWRPDDAQVNEILSILATSDNYPIYVHCFHGQDRTGLIIGLHRVLHERWDAAKAYEEMLDIGFHRILFPLDQYFSERTGYREY